MKIALIGATGHIGTRILAEALSRGHHVSCVTRNPDRLPARQGMTVVFGDCSDPRQVARAIGGCDVLVASVKWADVAVTDIIDAASAAAIPRAFFVIGAGSLSMPDGRLWFDHMADKGQLPPSSGPALAAFQRLQAEQVLDWVAVSPSADIEPGTRTAHYRKGGNDLIMTDDGVSRISTEDFGCAITDEIEVPSLSRQRFTVGY